MVKKDVGGDRANPMQTWSNLGKPRTLTKAQQKILQAAAEPCQTDTRLTERDGMYELELTVSPNHLCFLEITPVEDQTASYLGYDPTEFYGLT
jgi:xylan 1,4-beta-xylosidase